MRWLLVLSLCACHKQKPPSMEAAVAVDGVKDQAFKDLQNDVQLLRAQLMMVSSAVAATQPNAAAVPHGRAQAALYTCDRLAIAQKQLAEDARSQALLGEADALCAYRAPLLFVEEKLAALDGGADAPKNECLAVRDLFARVGQKYKNDAQVVAAQARFKIGCPKVKLVVHGERSSFSSGFSSGAPAGPDPRAQRDACKKRCDDSAFDCRSRCQYCGTCTTDKTWDWCNATCNSCRQGCEQNERFCQSSCGG